MWKFPFEILAAKAIVHSHSIDSIIASLNSVDQFEVNGLYHSQDLFIGDRRLTSGQAVQIPVIADDQHLETNINAAFENSSGVLVRGHGLFVWSPDSCKDAVKQFESYEKNFAIANIMRNQRAL